MTILKNPDQVIMSLKLKPFLCCTFVYRSVNTISVKSIILDDMRVKNMRIKNMRVKIPWNWRFNIVEIQIVFC